jgi:ribosomal protein L23
MENKFYFLIRKLQNKKNIKQFLEKITTLESSQVFIQAMYGQKMM